MRTPIQLAGGGDWVNERQEQQQMQVQKAYYEVQPKSQKSNVQSFTEIKMDGIDYAYVWARTFTPSWLMALIFIVGFLTVLPALLKKAFGIELGLTFKKGSKDG